MRISTFLATTTFTFSLALSSAAFAQSMTKENVETIVKEYLMTNPEVVVNALDAYQVKQELEAAQKAKDAIKNNQEALFNRPTVPSVGPADADVVVAQFFDYHCGYCKHMLPTITKLLETDKQVRVVFHELPILSQDSRLAARVALAVYQLQPDKYFAFHGALMQAEGTFSKEMLVDEAVKLGVDKQALLDAIDKEQLDNALKSSAKLAKDIGIAGTPAFVVGDTLIPGAISYEKLVELIKEKRGN